MNVCVCVSLFPSLTPFIGHIKTRHNLHSPCNFRRARSCRIFCKLYEARWCLKKLRPYIRSSPQGTASAWDRSWGHREFENWQSDVRLKFQQSLQNSALQPPNQMKSPTKQTKKPEPVGCQEKGLVAMRLGLWAISLRLCDAKQLLDSLG